MNNFNKVVLALLLFSIASLAGAQETRTYFAVDSLGSPVLATDENGDVLWEESYTPLGDRYTASANASDNSRWYTSASQNADSGLVDLSNRQYDPVVGRFLSMDPAGVNPNDPFTFNRYVYANNNPYSYLDPDGLSVYTKLFKLVKNGGDITLTLAGVVEDFNTLTDQSASIGDRAFAALSLASEVLPVGIRDVKEGAEAVSRIRKGASDGSIPNGPTVGGGARLENLSPREQRRLQNAADRSGADISVVGSQTIGTNPSSDFDYVIEGGTPRSRSKIKNSVPEGAPGTGDGSGKDFLPGPVDKTEPHITFKPKPDTR